MSLQTILLEGQVWELERPRSFPGTEAGAYGWSRSMALICPKCLKQWCVMAFSEDTDIHPQGQFCTQHGDGRLLLAYGPLDESLLSALPEALLRRELLLTLERERVEAHPD